MTDPLERQFEEQVIGLAAIYGWEYIHLRPAKTAHGWRTPVSGTLGMGWPDWTFVRAKRRRVLFRELKSTTGTVSPDQARVLAFLRSAGQDADVWRPADMDSGRILRELGG